MEKFLLRLTLIACLIFGAITLNSYNTGSFSTDLTGSPVSSTTCVNSCHNQFALNSGNGSVSITVPATYYPGGTYNVSVQVSQSTPTAQRFGFMAGVMRDNNSNGGSFTAGSGSAITTLGGRSYIKHNFTTNTTGSWSFTWNAPNYSDTINFYISGAATNNNNTNQGDYIYTGSAFSHPIPLVSYELDTTDLSCFGACDGELTVSNISGGEGGPYTVEWSNNATTNTISSLCSGVYTVTVTDGNGNEESTTIPLDGPDEINANFLTIPTSCVNFAGEVAVDPNGGTPPYSYEWNNGNMDSVIFTAPIGTYTITITDANGCTKVDSSEVTETGSGLIGEIGSSPENCDQGNGSLLIIMNNGTPPYTYFWNVGSTTNFQGDLSAGIYAVTVTDNQGCEEVFTDTVFETNAVIDENLSQSTDLNCARIPEGSAAVFMQDGVAPFSYNWSNNENTSSIENLFVGSYTVTVTDDVGCQDSISFTIGSPDTLFITYSTLPSHEGMCDGTINAFATGGTGTLTYSWSHDTTATDSSYSTLCTGLYHLTVTDENGCTVSVPITVEEILGQSEAHSEAIWFYPNPTSNNLFFKGDVSDITLLNLVDMQSRIVRKWTGLENGQLSLEGIPTGRYSLLIYTNDGFINRPVLISR